MLCAIMLCSVAANAANYSVTVTTTKQVQYRDSKTDAVVLATSEVGNALNFDVVADTPYEAEQIALQRCQGACDSGQFHLEQKGIIKNNVKCDKYVKVVPFKAEAKLK